MRAVSTVKMVPRHSRESGNPALVWARHRAFKSALGSRFRGNDVARVPNLGDEP
jgi:hypothetical protein